MTPSPAYWHRYPVNLQYLLFYHMHANTYTAQNIFLIHPMLYSLDGYETCLCPKITVIPARLRSVHYRLLSHSSPCPISVHRVWEALSLRPQQALHTHADYRYNNNKKHRNLYEDACSRIKIHHLI